VPYLSASAVVIHYEEALYKVFAPLPLPFSIGDEVMRYVRCVCMRVCLLGVALNKYTSIVTLRAKLSGAVYCYRSCLWRTGGVCLFVCGSVTKITRNCVHRSSPNWFVGKGSDHLQLIKFWPSRAPGNGVCGGAKIFGSALLQPARSVCVSLSAFLLTFFS